MFGVGQLQGREICKFSNFSGFSVLGVAGGVKGRCSPYFCAFLLPDENLMAPENAQNIQWRGRPPKLQISIADKGNAEGMVWTGTRKKLSMQQAILSERKLSWECKN